MSQHQHQMFPNEFLQYLVSPFNNIVKYEMLVVSINKLEVRFNRKAHSDRSVVISLFTKLVEAFTSISEKYIQSQDLHTRVRIQIQDNEQFFKLVIQGIIFIPPGKILNLFSLILWYFIRFTSGTKPSQSDFGINLTERWKKEEETLRYKINQSRRKTIVARDPAPCYICGETAYKVNEWEYIPGRSGISIDLSTRVCKKHIRDLI